MLLGRGRKDESGDLQKAPSSRIRKSQASYRGNYRNYRSGQRTRDFKAKKSFRRLGWCEQAVSETQIDKTVVRGLEYYTGPVYEVELTFEIKDEKGRPVRFVGGAAVRWACVRASGRSRYPRLDFGRTFAPPSRTHPRLRQDQRKTCAVRPVVVTIFDRDRVDYKHMVSALRTATLARSFYLGNPKTISAPNLSMPTSVVALRHDSGRRREGARRSPDQGSRFWGPP